MYYPEDFSYTLHRNYGTGLLFPQPNQISATPCPPPPLPPNYSQSVLVDVEGGGQRPLARHAAHVAARPECQRLCPCFREVEGIGTGRMTDSLLTGTYWDRAEMLIKGILVW